MLGGEKLAFHPYVLKSIMYQGVSSDVQAVLIPGAVSWKRTLLYSPKMN